MRLVFLDSKPLGMASNPRGKPPAVACKAWVRSMLAAAEGSGR